MKLPQSLDTRFADFLQALLSDIRQLIEDSRSRLAVTVNSALTLLYWHIGRRIHTEVLNGERAEYGEHIVTTLAKQLETSYGRGFSGKNLRHMLRFAESFPDANIVSTLSRQLAWSHFLELIYLKDPLQRDFYTQMCAQERWSVRRLRERKDTLLFERTALSRQPDEVLSSELAALRAVGDITPALVLKDPYILDFCSFPSSALILIHKSSSNPSYPPGSGYPMLGMAILNTSMPATLRYALPAGMTGFETLVYNDENRAWGTRK